MKKAKENYGYESTLPTRLRDTMGEKKVSPREIAEVCETTRQAVSAWMVGTSRPDVLSLPKIAKRLGVSTDYLLGASDYKSANKATLEMCKTLHLSENAIDLLTANIESSAARAVLKNMTTINGVCYDDHFLTSKNKKDVLTNRAKDFAFVVDCLFAECISRTEGNASLLDIMRHFFLSLESKDFHLELDDDIVPMPQYSMVLSFNEKALEDTIQLNPKELLITAAVNDILERLNSMKRESIQ